MFKRFVEVFNKAPQRDPHKELVEAVERGEAFITKWGEIRTSGTSGDFERLLTINDVSYLDALKYMEGEKNLEQKERLIQAYLRQFSHELGEPTIKYPPQNTQSSTAKETK